jgi:type I restriction enzyme S subunit
MASELPITDVVEFNPLRQIKRGAVAPFVDMAALSENQRDISYVTEREFTGSGSRFQNGDTLFARITPCLENGKTAKVHALPDGVVAHGSTEFIVMAAKAPEHDEDYVYYLARHPEFRAFAQGRMEGTSGRQRVSWQALSDFTFAFPFPDQRTAIGSILRKIDDKIDLNRRINQTLEAMAQAIFKSWFVDFDPVKAKIAAKAGGRDPLRAAMSAISGKTEAELDTLPPEAFKQLAATAALFPDEMEESELGRIPKGWVVRVMPDCIEVNPSRTLKKGTVAKYLDMANVPTNSARVQNVVPREFTSGSKFRNGDTLLARITPCLENGKTAFVDFLSGDEVGWGSTEFIVLRPKNGLPEQFAYFLCRHPDFRAFAIAQMAGTSGRQRVPNDCFGSYKLVEPTDAVAIEFGKLARAALSQIKAQDEEAKTLASLRDTLLPKLLSGELSVPEVLAEAGA